jgi:hypothetical protein
MTGITTGLAALAATTVLAVGAALAPGADHSAPRTAIVIDAPAARDGRALLDPRLRAIDADVRLPRDAAEARTDVRYFAAQGYDRIVVAGPRSTAAAHGAAIVGVADLPAALAAATR